MPPSISMLSIKGQAIGQAAGARLRTLIRRSAACLALVAAVPGMPGIAAAQGGAPATIPVTIELEPYLGSLWAFHARLGDTDGLFLFDTGGGTSAVTPAGAKLAGCTPWGRITGFRMRGDRLDLKRCDDVRLAAQGVKLTAPVAAVFDFMTLMPKDAPLLQGSIGLDAFAGKIVTIDLARHRLTIETASSFKKRIRGAREVPIHLSREVEGLALTPFLAVQTKDGMAWMELDTGSDGAVAVAQHLAATVGLDPAATAAQVLHLDIPNGPAIDAKAIVKDLIYDGNIGTRVLQNWIVTLDLAHSRMWLSEAIEQRH